MFFKIATFLAAVSVVLASPTPQASSQCNTGTIQCCNSVQPASALAGNPLIGLLLLDAIIQDLSIPIGVTCSPINIIGAGGGGNCNANPVCCTGDTFGSFSIACNSININL